MLSWFFRFFSQSPPHLTHSSTTPITPLQTTWYMFHSSQRLFSYSFFCPSVPLLLSFSSFHPSFLLLSFFYTKTIWRVSIAISSGSLIISSSVNHLLLITSSGVFVFVYSFILNMTFFILVSIFLFFFHYVHVFL